MATGVVARYRFKPFIGSSHTWALKELEKLPKDIAILDIGAGSCSIGEELKRRGYGNIYAVEIDAEALNKARGIYKRAVKSIDELFGYQFDVILLLDVLEHLSEPSRYLRKVIALLKENGIGLISVPNVAHWSVRIPLLFGFFNYSERAILDSSHLHFFTRQTFRNLLRTERMLKIESIDVTIEPVEFVLPEFLYNNRIYRLCSYLRIFIARLLPGFFAYQHTARVRKIGDSVKRSEGASALKVVGGSQGRA